MDLLSDDFGLWTGIICLVVGVMFYTVFYLKSRPDPMVIHPDFDIHPVQEEKPRCNKKKKVPVHNHSGD